MFVDTAKVQLTAGKGGDGAVSFRREIYIPKGGPDGGDGGNGGSIIFMADKDTNTLLDFRFNPLLNAEDGKNGSGQKCAGRAGEDLIVEVPIGTTIYRRIDGKQIKLADLTHDKEQAVIAKGGDGGFGNAHFKSSVRQAPIVHELGEPGDAFEAELELKLLADVGLVGLPNAGKSTFLSVVTNAKPEIADYPFTTITPNLGVATIDHKDILIADIPGLIEGASEGKGLGNVFLRHVDRTAVLLHLIDVYNDDAGKAYLTIRNELDKYSDLKYRAEIVALTKCEGVDDDIIKMQEDSIKAALKSSGRSKTKVFHISSMARQGTQDLLRALSEAVILNRKLENNQNEKAIKLEANKTKQFNDESDVSMDSQESFNNANTSNTDIPVIKLNPKMIKNTWTVEKTETTDGNVVYHVKGERIEKVARSTHFDNYA